MIGGVDGAIVLLSHVEIEDLKPLQDRNSLNQKLPNPFNPVQHDQKPASGGGSGAAGDVQSAGS